MFFNILFAYRNRWRGFRMSSPRILWCAPFCFSNKWRNLRLLLSRVRTVIDFLWGPFIPFKKYTWRSLQSFPKGIPQMCWICSSGNFFRHDPRLHFYYLSTFVTRRPGTLEKAINVTSGKHDQ